MMLDSHAHPAQMSGDRASQAVRAATQQSRLDEALRRNGGGRAWRAWKAGQLEEVMKDAEPSLGYSMLVQILAETRHRVVITTNFDNLVAALLNISGYHHPCNPLVLP